MTKKKTKIIQLVSVLFCLIMPVSKIPAQDVSFSQFYASPLYLNPAFAGTAGVPRFTVQHRSQWHSFNNAFSTYKVALDFPVEKLRGGLGVYLLNDAQANNLLNLMQLNLTYSVQIRLSDNYYLNGGIQGGLFYNSLKINELIFPDNLDGYSDNYGSSEELQYLTNPNYSFPDFSAGVMVYNNRLLYGAAVHHLAEPQTTYSENSGDVDRLHRKYTIHIGARFPVFLYGHLEEKFEISPHLILQQQDIFSQVTYGLMAAKNSFKTGLWVRQNIGTRFDALILQIGFEKKRWEIMYSYDVAISGLWGHSGGSSEITVSFLLKEKRENFHLPFFNPGK